MRRIKPYDNNTLKVIEKSINYLNYLQQHINNIIEAGNVVLFVLQKQLTKQQITSLHERCNNHDISKLMTEEFVAYRQRFFPTQAELSGTEPVLGFAWEHHKAFNRHHWQNWFVDLEIDNEDWKVDCVEMLIDWLAMSYAKGSNGVLEYYESIKDQMPKDELVHKFIRDSIVLIEDIV